MLYQLSYALSLSAAVTTPAEYCGFSPTCFSMWVASHQTPPATPGTRKWDKSPIDAKLDEISGPTDIQTDNVRPHLDFCEHLGENIEIAGTERRCFLILVFDAVSLRFLATGNTA
ncbi:hypothetical protein GR215_21130 [Rhizobium leguminosarum]|uniref:hypothetical protein n=1 Tax=Rhizobium leguminosarum TaxID=384 RepID=UPI0013B88F60|nr:hypothetical protein [Rhizobium leguminosarum]NEH44358.1 hypothetical protein [Rhizobium leguminosarum]